MNDVDRLISSSEFFKNVTSCAGMYVRVCLTLTPVAPGRSPLDSAAFDPAGGGSVQIHGVLHDGRQLGLDLRRADALLEEPCTQDRSEVMRTTDISEASYTKWDVTVVNHQGAN